jgi:flagellar FliL protein
MADILEQYLPKKKGPSLIVQIAVMAGMTVAALGIGWLSGSLLSGEVTHPPAAAEAPAGEGHSAQPSHGEEAAHGDAESSGGKHGGGKEGEEGGVGTQSSDPLVINLPTITTNLAAPSDTWLRLEVAVQLDKPLEDPTLPDTIQQDLLAFMRTVKLHQIEGASGFQHLKADLTERAAIRSDGLIKAVLIRTLLFE